jgi:H+/gluconate symporter-like permease
VLFILEPTGIAPSLARKCVTVIDYPGGPLAASFIPVLLLVCTVAMQRRAVRPTNLRI